MVDELIGVFTHIHGNITRILPCVIFFVFPLLFSSTKLKNITVEQVLPGVCVGLVALAGERWQVKGIGG
jgi:hypothetical protein